MGILALSVWSRPWVALQHPPRSVLHELLQTGPWHVSYEPAQDYARQSTLGVLGTDFLHTRVRNDLLPMPCNTDSLHVAMYPFTCAFATQGHLSGPSHLLITVDPGVHYWEYG